MTQSRNDKAAPQYRYRFGTAEFDQARFELRVEGQLIDVQRRPLEVLLALLGRPNEVMTQEQLMNAVWGGRPTVKNTLPVSMGKLRVALGLNESFVKTEHGVGYYFSGKLERTVVGEVRVSKLQLSEGAPVPMQPEFALQQLLGGSNYSEVWLARCVASNELQVFKFCTEVGGLDALKREWSVSRALSESFPTRTDFVRITGRNFEQEPFFLRASYAGQNLVDWGLKDGRLANLTQSERVQVFLRIADAVAAAHSIKVVHKDLKPSNVLVEDAEDGCSIDRCSIRVADFGSSRLLDPEGLKKIGVTQMGFTLASSSSSDEATPLYLAPEILKGQPVTEKSDIYALGLMLYQLLIGDFRQYLSSGWEREIEDDLLRQDILRATDVAPERRFESVQALSESLRSIERRRADQRREQAAMEALHATQRELQRVRARRPWMLATIGVLCAALAGLGWFSVRLSDANASATDEANRAEAVSGFLQDMLRNASPSEGQGYNVTLQDALERAESQLSVRFSGLPLTEAAVRRTAASLYLTLGKNRAAVTNLDRAVQLLKESAGELDHRTFDARYALGRALSLLADFKRAKRTLEEADKLSTPEIFREYPSLALAANLAWGKFHLFQLKLPEAEARFEAALKDQVSVDERDVRALLNIKIDLAQIYNHTSQSTKAAELLKDIDSPVYAEEIVGKVARARAASAYGTTLGYLERYDEGHARLEQALKSIGELFGPESANAGEQHSALAVLLGNQGEDKGSLAHTAAAKRIFCAMYGQFEPRCLQQVVNGVLPARVHEFLRGSG